MQSLVVTIRSILLPHALHSVPISLCGKLRLIALPTNDAYFCVGERVRGRDGVSGDVTRRYVSGAGAVASDDDVGGT